MAEVIIPLSDLFSSRGLPDFPAAACKQSDPEDFFPASYGRSDSASNVNEKRAIRVCRSCPHREQCLKFALRTDQEFGIWGGMTEKERIKRGQNPQRKSRK